MQFLFDALASLLALFYSLIPNYAMTIVLLTLLVMVVLTPLNLKGTRSMMLQQQLQPEVRKIQSRYRDDRQKLNEELMNLYRENNINPMGGCLPLFAQTPVFIVLYAVLRGLGRRVSDVGFQVGWSSGQRVTEQAGTSAPDLFATFDPAYLDPTSDLYLSLSKTNEMNAFGLDLSESAARAMTISMVEAIPYLVLILIVGASSFVQQKQIQGRIPKNQMNPQQQMLMRITPFMLPVFSWGLPGGLVLYFAVSNLYRIGQQWFISRSIYGIRPGETIDDKRARERAARREAGEADDDVEPASEETPRGSTRAAAVSSSKPNAKSAGRSAGKSAGRPQSKPAAQKSGSAAGAAGKSSRGDAKGRSAGGRPASRGDGGRSGSDKAGRDGSGPSSPVLQPRARKRKR